MTATAVSWIDIEALTPGLRTDIAAVLDRLAPVEALLIEIMPEAARVLGASDAAENRAMESLVFAGVDEEGGVGGDVIEDGVHQLVRSLTGAGNLYRVLHLISQLADPDIAAKRYASAS